MEKDLRKFSSDWYTKERPSVKIGYICTVCREIKYFFRPYPQNPENLDHRQYCWKCKQINPHLQRLPPS